MSKLNPYFEKKIEKIKNKQNEKMKDNCCRASNL